MCALLLAGIIDRSFSILLQYNTLILMFRIGSAYNLLGSSRTFLLLVNRNEAFEEVTEIRHSNCAKTVI